MPKPEQRRESNVKRAASWVVRPKTEFKKQDPQLSKYGRPETGLKRQSSMNSSDS